MNTTAPGTYVFCVTRESAPLPPLPGLDAAPLVEERSAGLKAIVCQVDLEVWAGEDSEDRLSDLEWLGPRALHHERINEGVMRNAPLLPLRFGCLFSSPAGVQAWVDRHRRSIERFLDATVDAEEWSIKGWINRDACARRLAEGDPRFAELPAAKGARYLQEKRLRRDIAAKIGPWIRGAEARLRGELKDCVILDRRLAAPRKDLTERTEDPGFHLAVLTRSDDSARLLDRIEALAKETRAFGLDLEVVGPWPPYSFSPPLDPTADGEGDEEAGEDL